MTSGQQKVALVTGGARRIGRAIALGLAQSGWDIAVHYGNSWQEAEATVAAIQALGRQAVAVQCDLADAGATSLLLERAQTMLGAISCLVNNASIFEFDDAASFSPTLLERHMRINLSAPIVLARALHASVPAGSDAVVINLLDQKLHNLNPDFMSYTLSKAALQCATTMLAQALAPTVRVVGIAPGITLVSGDQSDEGFARAHARTPLGRSSTAEDIASAVCFVAASKSITGTTLMVDGGQHLLPLSRDVMFLTT
ncbi:MAG: SDR family oxidoreductase [Pseudomonadota bacterium]